MVHALDHVHRAQRRLHGNCWLDIWGWDDSVGFEFNDQNCDICSDSYLCSSNRADPAPTPAPTMTPAPSLTHSPTPLGCADGWTEIEGSCFRFYTGLTNAPAAEAVCASAGGHLATIASAVQNAYAFALTDGGMTLIGLSDSANENDWVWADGSAVTYTNWASGQPGYWSDEDYAYLYYGEEWHDCSTNCGSGSGYLCSLPAPSAPPSVSPAPSLTLAPTSPGICSAEGTTTYEGHTVNCILADGQLYDIIPISNGISTCGANDANSCPDGTDIWVPRSLEHATAVWDEYGDSYIHFVGIYRPDSGCGTCTSYAMNSDAMASYSGVGWTSVAEEAEPWFMRSTTYSEPNGDYTAYCWLDLWSWDYSVGWEFNDNSCSTCSDYYLCSSNGADPAPTIEPTISPAPSLTFLPTSSSACADASTNACTEGGSGDNDCCATCGNGGCASGYTYFGQVTGEAQYHSDWYQSCDTSYCGNTCCVPSDPPSYTAVYNQGCMGYIHMDGGYYGGVWLQGGSTSLEDCARAVAGYDGEDGCQGDYFFYEWGGYCNCPTDACTLNYENTNAGSDGQLYMMAPDPTPLPTLSPIPTASPAPTVPGICSAEGTTTYEGHTVNCILVDGVLYDIIPISNGITTCGANDDNSCPDGTDIWVPRSLEHATAVRDEYGDTYVHFVGIYRPSDGCGSCTSYAMNSDAMASYSGVGWTSVAEEAEPWFMRSTTYSEPNGDYTAYCWLDLWGWDDSVGWEFNDENCNACSDYYLCSSNGADPAPTYAPTISPAPSLTFSPTSPGICSAEGTTTYEGNLVNCILVDGQLYDIFPISNGITTCGANDANSCPDGTDIWVPRSLEHATAVWDEYGDSYIHFVGIYRPASGCGSCTSYAMNSDAVASYSGVGWTSVAEEAEPWFMRSTTYGEPNGDYTAYCWLDIWGWDYSVGFEFNDQNCDICSDSYLCSSNGADPAPTYAPTISPAPSLTFLPTSSSACADASTNACTEGGSGYNDCCATWGNGRRAAATPTSAKSPATT